MTRIKNMLMYGLVLSFFITGCGQNLEQPDYAETSAIEKESGIAEQGDEMATKGSTIIEKATSEIESSEEIQYGAESVTESMKDDTASIIKKLIDKAKALLNQGKFEESIAAAQNVLTNHDSDSQEAKDIITTAKEKLKAIATENIEDLKGGDLTDKLKSFGQ